MVTPTAFASGAANAMGEDKLHRRSLDSLDYKRSFEQDFHDDEPEAQHTANNPASRLLPLYVSGEKRRKGVARYTRFITPLLWVLAVCISFYLGKHVRIDTSNGPPVTWAAAADVASSPLSSRPRDSFTFSNGSSWQRPQDLRIVGIVFYGRKEFVNILDCYLRRNLAANGGILDEVQFLLHTDNEDDKKWLRHLVQRDGLQEQYILVEEDTTRPGWSQWSTYSALYKTYMTDPNTIYVKIDDDVVFMEDHAIPELVRAVLEHPEAHSIQANVVNNRWTYWLHHRMNAIWPYLIDDDPSAKWAANSWRPSELPRFSGTLPSVGTNFTAHYWPPSARENKGHRWLPVEHSPSKADALAHTPYGPFQPNPEVGIPGHAVNWAIPAQSHYSLFENLERNSLHNYFYGNGIDGMYNLWYTRYNINVFAIRGSHVALKPFWNNEYSKLGVGDEYLLTLVIPQELRMPAYVATRAVVSHFSFHRDRERLLRSDILDRYRAYANEMVCTADNQKMQFAKKGNPHWYPENKPVPNKDVEFGQDADEDDIQDGPGDSINGDDHEKLENSRV